MTPTDEETGTGVPRESSGSTVRSGPGPERWLVLEVERPSAEEQAERVIDELMRLSDRGVEEKEDRLVAYLPDPGSDPEGPLSGLRARLREGYDLDLDVSHRWQAHEDWGEIWRRGFTARRVTPRIVVAPSWEDPVLHEGETLLSLDPGMAFGTAEHATTRGSLRLLDPRVRPGDRVADVGAGSGILSIAAALLGASRVIAVEMDSWSCQVARENADRNGVSDRVEVREAVVGPGFLPGEPPFDGILANIESGILIPLLGGFRTGLEEGGWLVLSGILEDEVTTVVHAAQEVGFELVDELLEEGWWTGGLEVP
jgi:ribosomal protein L11 methyltransferase